MSKFIIIKLLKGDIPAVVMIKGSMMDQMSKDMIFGLILGKKM